MHLEHKAKKYHVKFLKDYDAHDPVYRAVDHQHSPLTERLTQKNLEILFPAENSLVPSQSVQLTGQRESKRNDWN